MLGEGRNTERYLSAGRSSPSFVGGKARVGWKEGRLCSLQSYRSYVIDIGIRGF